MELTKAQQNFFADLDLAKALEASKGKVHFGFTHKGCGIEVEAYCSCDADIIVRRKDRAGVVSAPDKRLSIFNIPDTMNVSAEHVLRMVYAKAQKTVDSQLKKAWLDTPYVEQWYVAVLESRTEFTTNTEESRYRIEVSESPDDDSATVAKLFMSDGPIHTFTISQPYHTGQTAKSLLNLAEAIAEAWHDAVLSESNEEEPK